MSDNDPNQIAPDGIDSQLADDVEHHLRELTRDQLESSLAPEESGQEDLDGTPDEHDQADGHDGLPDEEVDQLDPDRTHEHVYDIEHALDQQPPTESDLLVDEASHQPEQDTLATYLDGNGQVAPVAQKSEEEEVPQGIPSLPVLPDTGFQPPHFSYPTSDYVPAVEAASAPEQYYPSVDQPAYPSYPTYPSYGEPAANGDASAEAGPSTTHRSSWENPSRFAYGEDYHIDTSSYYPQVSAAGEPAIAELVQQHSAASTGANYYLNYPEEGGSQGASYGVADDEELEPAEHLDGHEGGDDKGKKRSADGKVKKDSEKAPRAPGQKAPPKEVKLGPDGKPKIELACHPCRQRKIRCDSEQPSCSTCTRRSIQCVYPTERRFRGPGRKKNPPHILNPDGSLVAPMASTSASPHELEIGPDGEPIASSPQKKKKKVTKKARLAQEAGEAAAHEMAGGEQIGGEGMGHLDHQIHEHLMQQHHQQQMEQHAAGGASGDGGEMTVAEADALMIAEALVGAAALGGMSGGLVMGQEQEHHEESQHLEEGVAESLHEMSGLAHDGEHPEGDYPGPDGEEVGETTGQHELEIPPQDGLVKLEHDPDAA